MRARLAGVGLLALCLAGCGGPEFVIEDSEQPLFLGHGNLLTARADSQEVNVRRITEEGISFRQSWLDPLSPAERSFHFDPILGHLLSVGALPAGEHPLRAGSPHRRRQVLEQLRGGMDRAFALRSWPESEVLANRSTWPGLARNPQGSLLIRASREARFELYSTVQGTVVALGPPVEADEREHSEDSIGPPPRLSGACFTGPESFAYAWEGQVYLARLEGERCHSERLTAGSALTYRAGRLYVLVKNRYLRAFELETRRPLWQSEDVAELASAKSSSGDAWPWTLRLSPSGNAIAVEASEAFLVADTRQGRILLGPAPNPRDLPWRSLALGDERCAAVYFSGERGPERQVARVWNCAPGGLEAPLLLLQGDEDAPLAGKPALSADGRWLALSRGSSVEVWRLR